MPYEETLRALESFTDNRKFELLASILLAEVDPRIRPLGGSGDRARDAVGGLYQLGKGEELIAMYSCEVDWDGKIRRELGRIEAFGWQPTDVIAVTNRQLTRSKEQKLQELAEKKGWALTIFGQEWLAVHLEKPSCFNLREEYLGGARPRPNFFLTLDEFVLQLHRTELFVENAFIGRTADLKSVITALNESVRYLILTGEGGIGKTRLLMEASKCDSRGVPWFFVPEGPAFNASRLSELDPMADLVIVIDNAHRRGDLSELLTTLERRRGRNQFVLISRPGYKDKIRQECPLAAIQLRKELFLKKLHQADLAEILKNPPFGIERSGLRAVILRLAEGNPQIAVFAAKLTQDGTELHALSRDSMFQLYSTRILKAATQDSKQLQEIAALVTALGMLDVNDEVAFTKIANLLELSRRTLKQHLDTLTERGLLTERSEQYSIKPDLLSEGILFRCFFNDATGSIPILRYEDVYKEFAPTHRLMLLEALGQTDLPKSHRAASALGVVRRDLFMGLNAKPLSLPFAEYARFAKVIGYNHPELSLELIDALIATLQVLDAQVQNEIATEVAEALALVMMRKVKKSWERLLQIAKILFAQGNEGSGRQAVIKKIQEVFLGYPVDTTEHDGYILAFVQRSITEVTRQFWEAHRTEPGAALATVTAACTLLTLHFTLRHLSAEDKHTVQVTTVTMPATTDTQRMLREGAALIIETFLLIPPVEQLKVIPVLQGYQRQAAGYPVFGELRLSELTQNKAKAILKKPLEPWFRQSIAQLSMPVAAQVVDLFGWLFNDKKRRLLKKNVPELIDYIALMTELHRNQGQLDWNKLKVLFDKQAKEHAKRLAASSDPLTILDRWNQWLEQATAIEMTKSVIVLPLALAQVAKLDRALGLQLVDHILTQRLLIWNYTGFLLQQILATSGDQTLINRIWKDTDPAMRRMLANAVIGLGSSNEYPILLSLAGDPDYSVRNAAWCSMRWSNCTSSEKFAILLKLIESPVDHDLSGVILDALVLEGMPAQEHRNIAVPRESVPVIWAWVLSLADLAKPPEGYALVKTLGRFEAAGFDYTLEWIARRIEKFDAKSDEIMYPHGLVVQLQKLVVRRRQRQIWRDDFNRFCAWLEENALSWQTQNAIEQVIWWLGGESVELTERMVAWARLGEHGVRRALNFLSRTPWGDLFIERALRLLEVWNDEWIRLRIYRAPEDVNGFSGLASKHSLEMADRYRSWLDHPSHLLRQVGLEAVESFTKLAEENLRREQEEENR